MFSATGAIRTIEETQPFSLPHNRFAAPAKHVLERSLLSRDSVRPPRNLQQDLVLLRLKIELRRRFTEVKKEP